MQTETKNLILIAAGSFFGGVLVTLLVFWLALAITRPCHKEMRPLSRHEMEQPLPNQGDIQNQKRNQKRKQWEKGASQKRVDFRKGRVVPATAARK